MGMARLKLLTVLFLGFFTELALAQSAPIRIGGLLHLTGEFARQGIAFREGIDLAVAEINASGGIGGRKLEAVYEDTQYKPLHAHTGAKRLLLLGGLSAVLISTATEAKAAGPLFQQAKLPAIVLWDASPEIESIGDYLFGIGPWAPHSGEKAANFAFERLRARKAVAFCSNTEWSQFVCKYFVPRFRNLGGEVLKVFSINPDENDFRTFIAQARALKADVWYAPIDGNIIAFFQQVKQNHVNVELVTSDLITEEYFLEAPAAFEGVYQTMTGDPNFPESQSMFASYEKFFDRPVSQRSFVSWGYDATKLIAFGLSNGAKSPQQLREELLKVKNYNGASGAISFTKRGSAPREISLFRVENAEFRKVN